MQMKLITLLFKFFEHILQGMAQKRYASGISTKYLYSDQLQVSYLWHPLAMKMVGSPRHIPLCFSVWHSSTSMTQSFVPLAKSLHLANYYHWYATLGSGVNFVKPIQMIIWIFNWWFSMSIFPMGWWIMNKHSEFKDYLEFPENPAKKNGWRWNICSNILFCHFLKIWRSTSNMNLHG